MHNVQYTYIDRNGKPDYMSILGCDRESAIATAKRLLEQIGATKAKLVKEGER